jgi:two-component system, OmpR family, sensor kinase
MTLRWRLTLLYSLLMTALLTLITTGFYGVTSNYLFGNIEQELRGDGDKVIKLTKNLSSMAAVDIYDLSNPINEQISINTKSTLVILDPNNLDAEVIPFNISLDLPTLPGIKNPIAPKHPINRFLSDVLAKGEIGTLFTDGVVNLAVDTAIQARPAKLAVIYLPLLRTSSSGQQELLPTLIYLARDTSFINDLLTNLRITLTFISFLGILATAFGSYWLAWRALDPLREVEKAATKITTGRELNRRVPEPNTGDEVQELAKSLNDMLERLESSFESQRRFTADASHELRTPITAITGHVGYLLRRTQLDEQQRDSLSRIASEGERLKKLVADLLDLARADIGFQLELGDVRPVLVAEDVHLELVSIAGETEIEVLGERGLTIRADQNRLKQVMINLVQNAIKAGAAHITVKIEQYTGEQRNHDPRHTEVPAVTSANESKTTDSASDYLSISISDDGPGIAAEHLSKLFDRFYRIDTARNRAQGGSGLGLSIVKWIIDAHKGQIQVASQVGVGTRFEILLPMQAGITPTVAVNSPSVV